MGTLGNNPDQFVRSSFQQPLRDKGNWMSSRIARLFLDHPRNVGETYMEHQAFALGFSMRMFAAAFAALIHALLPFAFEKTASSIVREMVAEMDRRGQPAKTPTPLREIS